MEGFIMSLLDKPQAQALLADAVLTPAAVRSCQEHLTEFLQRYLPLFYRREQRDLATLVIQGRLSGLQRKTSEPIAHQAGHTRKPVQHFVGAGAWDDEAVMAELRRHVAEAMGDPGGVLVVDSSGFPKKGTASCGVGRQWCGRLGKLDNCQVGVFLAYAAPGGHAPLDRRLFLPQDWAADPKRRRKTGVPREVVFQEKWRIALDLLERSGPDVPHGWVVGDDEFGRATEFRAELRHRRERYVLDVPANTLVREVAARPDGTRPPFERAEVWAARQPASRWKTLTVRDGAKGALKVRALKRRVQTKEEGGHVGPTETLTVIRRLGAEPQTWYTLSNARRRERRATLVRVHGERHRIEEVLQEGKGEVGLADYEVRGWVGWHHHMTLALLALWFVTVERRRLGGENPGADAPTGSPGFQPLAPRPAPGAGGGRRGGQPRAAA
ncbi:MAG TPA: IS701 family transposase [Streptosporangiaceae bacterium]|jgi:SRSO17 transposase|nr:IS701 family transposase [Streptosporangiaceae bacterium]